MAKIVSDDLLNGYWNWVSSQGTVEVGVGAGPDELSLETVCELARLLDERCQEYVAYHRCFTDYPDMHCCVRFYECCCEFKAELKFYETEPVGSGDVDGDLRG